MDTGIYPKNPKNSDFGLFWIYKEIIILYYNNEYKKKKYNNAYYVCLNQMHDYKDQAKLVKEKSNYEDKFTELIISTTREKIFKELIKIFRLIKKENTRFEILDRTSKLTKRIKLHLHQLKKHNDQNYEDQQTYFTHALKIVYSIVLCL